MVTSSAHPRADPCATEMGAGRGFPKLVSLSDPYNQVYSIVETILGSPDLWKLPNCVQSETMPM